MTLAQRQELHAILHYAREPCKTPFEYSVKQCIMHFLNGRDALAELEKRGIPGFTAKLATQRAAVFLNNERAKRRRRGAEILAERDRLKNARVFTSENFRVTMDNSQHRNYGMVNISIYCLVEVWEEDVVEKEYLINFSDYKTKEWLTRLLVWGLMNKREILLKPASEDEMSSMKMFVPKEKVPA